MKIVDPENTKTVSKENLITFFLIPGFLDPARVEHILEEFDKEHDDDSFVEIPGTSSLVGESIKGSFFGGDEDP